MEIKSKSKCRAVFPLPSITKQARIFFFVVALEKTGLVSCRHSYASSPFKALGLNLFKFSGEKIPRDCNSRSLKAILVCRSQKTSLSLHVPLLRDEKNSWQHDMRWKKASADIINIFKHRLRNIGECLVQSILECLLQFCDILRRKKSK